MPRIKSTIQSGPVIRSTITSTGAVGPQGLPGPNQVTDSTASNLQGVLVADGNKVREALPGEVVDSSALQAALWFHLPSLPTEFPDTPGVAWRDGELVKVTPDSVFHGGVLNAKGVLYSDSLLETE